MTKTIEEIRTYKLTTILFSEDRDEVTRLATINIDAEDPISAIQKWGWGDRFPDASDLFLKIEDLGSLNDIKRIEEQNLMKEYAS